MAIFTGVAMFADYGSMKKENRKKKKRKEKKNGKEKSGFVVVVACLLAVDYGVL
jgi:hypothetical protein